MTGPGTVYLLHFDRPLGNPANPRSGARHYVGWANDLDGRLRHHRDGNGARIMAALATAGIGFEVARTWTGGRTFERSLKNRHNTPRLCPLCSPRAHLSAVQP